MAQQVPTGDAVRFGWETFGRNVAFLIGVYLVACIVVGIVEGVAELDAVEDSWPASILMWVLSILTSGVIEMGLIAIALTFVAGAKPEFGDLFNRVPLVWKYVAAQLLLAMMVIAGLVLFIIPGIYLGIRFSFFGYFVVDEQVGPLDALQKSWDLTNGRVWSLLGFYLTLFGINILGLLCLVVGLLVTLPLSALATAMVYRALQAPPPLVEGQASVQTA